MKPLSTILILGVLVSASGAGLVCEADCPNCGYESAALHLGGGMNPLFSYVLYLDEDAERLVSVGFDAAPAFFAALGVEEPPALSAEYWELFEDNYELYTEVMNGWTPPETLTVATVPEGLRVTLDGAPLDADSPTLLRAAPLDESTPCPHCGRTGLDIKQTGVWD
ncbi:MAG: hypothetical protein GF403_07120 [Candidatus Coatesbacteria bacterium]|nr:hypothetical protein [Candidatus Coatesbacteria bacterium]